MMRVLGWKSVCSAVCNVCVRIKSSFLSIVVILSNFDLVHYNFLVWLDFWRLGFTFHWRWLCLNQLWIIILNLISCRLISRIVVRDNWMCGFRRFWNTSVIVLLIIFRNSWSLVVNKIDGIWIILSPWILMLNELGILMDAFWNEWRHLSCGELFRDIVVIRDCCQFEQDPIFNVWNVHTPFVLLRIVEVFVYTLMLLPELMWRY